MNGALGHGNTRIAGFAPFSMNKTTASLLVLIGTASYGLLAPMVKLAYAAGFSNTEVNGSQMLLGTGGLWLISLPYLKQLRSISWKNIGLLLGSGSFSGMTAIFYYYSLQELPASLAIILLFQFAWMGILVEWFHKKRAPNRFQIIAIIFILFGTFLAVGLHTLSGDNIPWLPFLTGLASAITYTAFLNFSGTVATHIPSLLRSTLLMSGSMLLVLIVFPPRFLISGALGEGLWFWGGLIGLFSAIIPAIFITTGAPHIGTGMVSIIGSIELPVSVVLSYFVLAEPINMWQWIGITLILLGILVSNRDLLIKRE